MTLRRVLWPTLIAAVVLVLLLPVSPLFRPVPSEDPSVYLYVGQGILRGEMPYRDIWDHKQPLAFVLFALAQLITPDSLWGIWLIEVAGLVATVILADRLLYPVATRPVRVLAVLAGLLTLVILLWAFSLEELSLPLQMLALWAFARWLTAGSRRGRIGFALLVGVSTGVVFFLKQNLIAAGVTAGAAMFLEWLMRRDRQGLYDLLALAGGFALVAAPVLGWLAAGGSLPAYLDAAFVFNLAYSGLGPLERVNAVLNALETMAGTPGLFLAFALWLSCAAVAAAQAGPALAGFLRWRLFRPILLALGAGLIVLALAVEFTGGQPGFGLAQWGMVLLGIVLLATGAALLPGSLRDRLGSWLDRAPLFAADTEQGRTRQGFFTLAAMYFPIALALISLSGRGYVYYYIVFVPPLILMVGLVAGTFLQLTRGAAVVLLALGLALAYNPLLLTITNLRKPANPPLPAVVDVIQARTQEGDTILTWNTFITHLYFLADRRAPTPYFYQAPMVLEGYNARFGIAEALLEDLRANPPALIIYSPGEDVPAPAPDTCPFGVSDAPNSIGMVNAYICEAYRMIDLVEGVWVFERRSP